MFKNVVVSFAIFLSLVSCNKKETSKQVYDGVPIHQHVTLLDNPENKDSIDLVHESTDYVKDTIPQGWKEIKEDSLLRLDLRYASKDNFTSKPIYNCPRCFLRPEVQGKLMEFANHLNSHFDFGLIIYDCYRPRPYQKKLWDIMPDPRFVTHPDKGSMHTRGMAIDIGLINSNGELLDMGTPFDHFGPQSFHSATDISEQAISNRKLLKEEISKFGFKPITSEWWHYSYRENIQPLSDWVWECK